MPLKLGMMCSQCNEINPTHLLFLYNKFWKTQCTHSYTIFFKSKYCAEQTEVFPVMCCNCPYKQQYNNGINKISGDQIIHNSSFVAWSLTLSNTMWLLSVGCFEDHDTHSWWPSTIWGMISVISDINCETVFKDMCTRSRACLTVVGSHFQQLV